ncbi:hypothetical protein FIBSPDRAFT_949593 [Athelia psychrophila]|uniref:Uncharacterized protein n=1 Tax=Athelia psychrophila TaxID=1759441 RepID=A0A166PHY7_9AGAM|nr:hypothetical protein FIBSPDRAFT_949593 [Fibularhizoctonia sp. CBS 109695]
MYIASLGSARPAKESTYREGRPYHDGIVRQWSRVPWQHSVEAHWSEQEARPDASAAGLGASGRTRAEKPVAAAGTHAAAVPLRTRGLRGGSTPGCEQEAAVERAGPAPAGSKRPREGSRDRRKRLAGWACEQEADVTTQKGGHKPPASCTPRLASVIDRPPRLSHR